MIDKDTNRITVQLECKCVYSYTQYFSSGIQYQTIEDYLYYKYNMVYNPNKKVLAITDINKFIDKIKPTLEVIKICKQHTELFIIEIIKGSEQYYKHTHNTKHNKLSKDNK